MKIVTTPMCQEVLRLADVQDFAVMKYIDSADADIAVVLSETNTSKKSIKLKLNTFSQIDDSIRLISETFGTKPLVSTVKDHDILDSVVEDVNSKVKVKVYSKFLGDIVEDLGFTVVRGYEDVKGTGKEDIEKETYNFLVYPDYMENKIEDEIKLMGERAVKIPSHGNTSPNPIERAKLRYSILEKRLCTKL
jgi:hypothetical protein